MSLRHYISLVAIALVGHAFAGEPEDACSATMDSAAIVEAIHQVEPWIAKELDAIQNTSDIVQIQAIASKISQRTDSLAKRFRTVFPDNEADWAMFSLYSGLAAATDACNPGLAAVYRGSAAVALYSGVSPYRPSLYQALHAISDRSCALAHAKREVRSQRLIEKLRADHVDLITAL